MQKRKISANPFILVHVPKYLSRSKLENAYPHLMFSFTNKKVMGF